MVFEELREDDQMVFFGVPINAPSDLPDEITLQGRGGEDLIPNNNWTGPAEPSLGPPIPTGCFDGAHPRIAVARTRTRWPVGNDSPYNGQSATLSNHFHSGRKRRRDK